MEYVFMGKTAIVTDTNSGITIQEGAANDIFVLPMPFNIGGEDYIEGVNLTQERFYELLENDVEIHTSQPTAGDVMELWNKALKDYDEVVHIPMSSGLSGSCEHAILYSREFDGRVQVVDNRRISVTQRQSVYDAKAMAESGVGAVQIKETLEREAGESSIYIMLDTLYYLKKGGRITPAAAAFAKILNLKPILQIQGAKLDAFSKCRGIKQAKSIMINAIKSDIDERFGGFVPNHPTVWLQGAYTKNREAADNFIEELKVEFEGFDIHFDPLPLSIACHIGPGALALACSKFIEPKFYTH